MNMTAVKHGRSDNVKFKALNLHEPIIYLNELPYIYLQITN